MTAMSTDVLPAAAPSRWRGRTAVRTCVLGLVLVLVAGSAWAGWSWRSHPAAFVDAGGYGFAYDDLHDGVRHYAGMSDPADGVDGEVTVHSAEAHVVEDSADADIRLFVCTIDESSGVGAVGVVSEADVRDECSSLVPAEGATLRLAPVPAQQLVLSFSLPHAGTLRIRGVDVDYSHGWRRGTQRVGGDLDATRR